jgi:hypothetical protein
MHRITADKDRTKFIKEDNQQGESIFLPSRRDDSH